jgi:cell division protein FtsB
MTVTAELRKRLRHVVAPTIGACVFGYFVYHAIQGDRGIMAWLQVSQQLADSRATLAALILEREDIQRSVALLSPSSLDPDMLDERARVMLNVAEPDDRLVTFREIGPSNRDAAQR